MPKRKSAAADMRRFRPGQILSGMGLATALIIVALALVQPPGLSEPGRPGALHTAAEAADVPPPLFTAHTGAPR